ncbi:MAG: Carbohydrate kinase [Parcubacteria group bacterium GW2011_GWA2_38_13]|nr:MAG: Carbohydrate kinase [Parcubacteria group bacterium GW2011_GWA2_38_13]
MKKTFDVVSIGGIVRDITFYTDKGRIIKTPDNLTAQKMIAFEYGAKINIFNTNYTLGGGASNTAHVFSLLGLKTAIIARIGKDIEGELMMKKSKEDNISTDAVQIDSALHTGYSLILCSSKKEHDHVVYTYRGANENLVVDEKVMNPLDAKWYYISSMCGSNWLKTMKNIIAFAKKKNIKIAWNPGNLQLQAGRKNIEKILKCVDALFLNKDEAIELVLSGVKIGKRDPAFLNKTLYLLHILNEWGPKTVVITEGKKGAYALRDDKVYKAKVVKKKVADTTGVGDAFGASFVASMIEEPKNIERALRWGVVNSAYNLTKVGAQEGVLTRQELLEKIK